MKKNPLMSRLFHKPIIEDPANWTMIRISWESCQKGFLLLIIWIQWSLESKNTWRIIPGRNASVATMVFSFSFKKKTEKGGKGLLPSMALLFWLKTMGVDSSLSSPSFLGAAHPPVVLLVTPGSWTSFTSPGASARVDRGVVAMGSQPFSVAANEGASSRSYKLIGTRKSAWVIDFHGGNFDGVPFFFVRWKNQRQIHENFRPFVGSQPNLDEALCAEDRLVG